MELIADACTWTCVPYHRPVCCVDYFFVGRLVYLAWGLGIIKAVGLMGLARFSDNEE